MDNRIAIIRSIFEYMFTQNAVGDVTGSIHNQEIFFFNFLYIAYVHVYSKEPSQQDNSFEHPKYLNIIF